LVKKAEPFTLKNGELYKMIIDYDDVDNYKNTNGDERIA
jgi:hypothetical protein